jgi:hypothetical protein
MSTSRLRRLPPVFRRYWLSALLSVASLLLLVAVLAQLTIESWRTHRSEHLDKAMALNRSVRSHADIVIEALAGDIRAIAGALAQEPSLLAGSRAALGTLLDRLSMGDQALGVVVVDPAGAVIASRWIGERQGADTDPARRLVIPAAEFARHSEDPGVGVLLSAPFRAGLVDAEILTVSYGVRAQDGTFLGMVAAAVPVERLLSLFLELRPLPGTRMALVRVATAWWSRVTCRRGCDSPRPCIWVPSWRRC